ncbi:hypothetical protein Tco_1384641 [Tanacetum coccineum]
MIVDIEDDIMDPVMQCTTLPSHSSFSQKKLVSFVTEIHTLSIDISLRDLERETKETTDKEQSNFQGSTAQIPPPVTPIPTLEPDVPKTFPKTTPILEPDVPKSLPQPNIPYPSRRDDQKSRDKASNQMEKIFQIFQDLRFDISFARSFTLIAKICSNY